MEIFDLPNKIKVVFDPKTNILKSTTGTNTYIIDLSEVITIYTYRNFLSGSYYTVTEFNIKSGPNITFSFNLNVKEKEKLDEFFFNCLSTARKNTQSIGDF